MKLTVLFIERSNMLELLRMMKINFWKVEDVTDEQEKLSYDLIYHRAVQRFKIITTLSVTSAVFFYLGRFFSDWRPIADNLPFESYMAPGVPYYILFCFEALVGFRLVLPILALDVLMLSIMTLTEVQFKMLNKRLRSIFDFDDGVRNKCQIIHDRIRRCYDHHSFLMR